MATRLNRILQQCHSTIPVLPRRNRRQELFFFGRGDNLPSLASQLPALRSSVRFLDFYQLASKEAIKKERERITDEMHRGVVTDMKELREHGGKIAVANKILIPSTSAVKFPVLLVVQSDGKTLKLPVISNSNEVKSESSTFPKVSLVCLSFRSSSQVMVDSWSKPFLERFSNSKDVHLYEVSFVDHWLLCLSPIKRLLLQVMRKSNKNENTILQRQIVYSFGDHYYFRKELRAVNLLTGYIFLLDKFGRIRWQGFGKATPEEISSLLSCTSLLMENQ